MSKEPKVLPAVGWRELVHLPELGLHATPAACQALKRRAEDGAVETEVIDDSKSVARYELVSKMRASFWVRARFRWRLARRRASRASARMHCAGACGAGAITAPSRAGRP